MSAERVNDIPLEVQLVPGPHREIARRLRLPSDTELVGMNVAVAGKAVLEGAVEGAETLVEERWVEFWLEAGNARRRKIAAMQAEAALKYGAPKGARS